MSNTERVVIEIVIAAPVETVWRAFRDPAQIARWFGWEYPGLAEEIDVIFAADVSVSEADHELRFGSTGDSFTLAAQGDGATLVRLVRAAPAAGTWEDIYDDITEGWITFVQQLRFALERQPGAERRTVFLSGRSPSGAPAPIAALGLDALRDVPVGGRYRLDAVAGDALEGEVWFRSPYQCGLSVDGFGDGLLVVADRPRTSKSPHGGGMAVLTLYGFDDAAVGAVRARWADWWRSRFEDAAVHPAA